MADVTISRNTFPAEGGDFRVEITKNDNRPWSVSIPTDSWHAELEQAISSFLYRIDFSIDPNTGAADRSFTITAGSDLVTESFTLTQYGTAGTLSADIISVTPAGNVAAAGGQITVDVEAVNGVDASTTASISTGNAYTTLTSTTHGITSGGVTVTRFVFTVDPNSGTSTRAITLNFTVQDSSYNTASVTVNKTQNGLVVQQGSLAATDVSLAATDTAGSGIITQTDMNMATVTATPAATWVTDAQVQVVGGQYVCALTTAANTGASARTTTVVLAGDDTFGNTISVTFNVTQAGTSATHAISASWDNDGGTMDFNGGTQTATVTYTGSFTGQLTIVSASPLPTGMQVTTNGSTEIRAYWNGGTVTSTTVITITAQRTGDDNNVYTVTLYLTLVVGGVYPIWRDVYGTINSEEDWEDYTLSDQDGQFYAGRAFAYPNESSITVNVSRVVAPYLTSYYKDIVMESGGVQVAAFTFVRDYSYDPAMNYNQNLPLVCPVNGRIPAGVKITVAEWGAGGGGSLQVTDENGTLVVNEALVKGLNAAEFISGTVGKVYTFGNEKFTVVEACKGALLKYVNAYGGVDYLLVEGVCKKTDKITRASYEKDADALSQDFEVADYQATMEATWQGTTGWLTDRQSLRMKHLVESVEVYMLDLSTGDEMPVVMRDSQLQYKTFENNGRKLVNYTLAWTESQKKLRR